MKQKEQSQITKAPEVIIDDVFHDNKEELSNRKIQRGENKVGQIISQKRVKSQAKDDYKDWSKQVA